MAVDWQRHWDTVYQTRTPTEVSWHQDNPARSRDLIRRSGISRSAPIVDVGGGASRLVDYLLADGFTNVTVVDVSAAALQYARQRLGPAAERVTWVETDIMTFSPGRRFKLWHDRAVFHFLTEAAERQRYLTALRAGLAPRGHVVMATFGPGGPERCSGLPVRRYSAATLAAEFGGFVLVEEEQELHVTPAGTGQQFQYCWLRREA